MSKGHANTYVSRCTHNCSTTGVSPYNTTLKIDIGGAVIYVTPKGNSVDVSVNSENLIDGDFKYLIWDGQKWII